MKQVEINGVVYEFDEKLILKQEIQVGQNVQILKKEYSDSYKLYPAVVTQILPFSNVPVVEVVYVDESYSSCEIKKALISEGSDSVTIIAKEDALMFTTKERCLELLNNEILNAEERLRKARANLEYFKKYFGMYFSEIVECEEGEKNVTE